MAEAFDQIGAAVPLRRFGRIGLVLALVEEQRAPSEDQRAVVEGKLQIVRTVDLLHRRDRAQIGEDRVAVLARDLGVGGKRHRRIDQPAVGEAPVMHHLVELVGRPLADAGLRIGRDVGGVERAERRLHRQAAGKGLAFARGVAGDAVAGAGQVFALGDQRPHPAPSPATRRSASNDCERKPGAELSRFSAYARSPLSSARCRRQAASAGCRAWQRTGPSARDATTDRPRRP